MSAGSTTERPVSPLAPMWTAAALTSLLTIVIAADRNLRFAYEGGLEIRVALETTVAMIGVVLGAFFVARYRASGTLGDLAAAVAILAFSFTNLVYASLPRLIGGADEQRFGVWASLASRTLGAAVLAAAPFLTRSASRRTAAVLATAGAVSLTVIGVLIAFASPHLPDGVVIVETIVESARPRVATDPAIVALQLLAVAFLAVATVGFARRARRDERDQLWAWLAAGSVCQLGSRIHFVLFPSLYSDWLYTGDLLRFAGYLAWLVGAIREIEQSGRERERLAVLDERRRIARELHDGIAQDISFIHSHAAGATPPTPEIMQQIAGLAQRALIETRLAIDVLTDDGMPPEAALRRAAESIATPAGLEVTCSFQPGVRVPDEVRHDLMRIVREATTNAVRHAGASSLAIQLDVDAEGGLWLMVADDGVGFDTSAPATGFGLDSMRERAEHLGGRLTVTSEPGHGTIVELQLGGVG